MQRVAPELIRQHNRAGSIRPIVRRSQQPPQHRPQSHHLEVVSVDDAGRNLARRAKAHDREVDFGECAQLLNGLQACADILDLGNGERRVVLSDARRALPQIEQPALVWFASGRSSTARTTLKMAALAPMPSASVSAT